MEKTRCLVGLNKRNEHKLVGEIVSTHLNYVARTFSKRYLIILLLAFVLSLLISPKLSKLDEFEFFALGSSAFPIIIFYFKNLNLIPFESLEKYRQKDFIGVLKLNEDRQNWFRWTANVLLGCWAVTLLLFLFLIILRENQLLLELLTAGHSGAVLSSLGGNILNHFLVSAGYTQLIFSVLAVFVQLLNKIPKNRSFLDEWILVKEHQFDIKAWRIGILYFVILLTIFFQNQFIVVFVHLASDVLQVFADRFAN